MTPKRNKALMAMTTGFLWHAYSQNPNAKTFPWGGCNEGGWEGDVPRWAVLEELQQRPDGRFLLYPGLVSENWGYEAIRTVKSVTSGYLNSIKIENLISVVISSSPTPNRDDISVLEVCYLAMRKQLPNNIVYLLLDGVREEQTEEKSYYEDYKKKIAQKVQEDPNWRNVVIIESPEFRHEAGQMRAFMQSKVCLTPLICYLQHDAILEDDYIDWTGIAASLMDGNISCIRFALDIGFPQGKEHMFRGSTLTKFGIPLLIITELFVTACVARSDFFDFIVAQFNTARCHLDGDEIQPITAKDNGQIRRIGCYCPPENEERGYRRVVHADARRAGVENPPPKLRTEF